MAADPALRFRHLGGGQKGLFVALRYVFIVTASYLVIFQRPGQAVGPGPALMIAVALASNVVLSVVRSPAVFAWYVEAPIMVADTIWVSWALHQTGASGQELFLLYFFVIFLAAVGENPLLAIAGSTVVGGADAYFTAGPSGLGSSDLLRVVFFYAVAIFYGHVMSQVRRERQRADRGVARANELESMVAERTHELRRLYGESLAASRLKTEFVANMSHELRTPLNVIVGYADMLLDRDAPSELERIRLLRRVREAACGLKRLVDGVLDLGKLESGVAPVERRVVALDRWVREAMGRERLPLAEGVRLDWRLAERLPAIETDEDRLNTIVENLVNNAIKFTRAGAITVTVRDLALERCIQIQVDDTGCGMSPATLLRVFEPFQQGEDAARGPHGGVGLGLAIVHRNVSLLGGTIDVRSAPGMGTTFTVLLPYAPGAAAAEDAPTPAPARRVA